MTRASADPIAANHRESTPWLIAMVGSAGGIHAIRTILSGLPADLPASIVIVQHRPPHLKSYLRDILARHAHMPVRVAEEGDVIQAAHIYLARPDFHLIIGRDGRFLYQDGRRIRYTRSS